MAGNTNITLCAMDGTNVVKAAKVRADLSVAEAIASAHKQLTGGLQRLRSGAIASVNPNHLDLGQRIALGLLGEELPEIGYDIPLPVVNKTKTPETTGVDRLLNALAAHKRAKGAAIVVDCGTAITVSVVNKAGEFLGGAIAPGIGLMLRSLHEGTAKLPLVEPKWPKRAIGKTTEEAIQSGVLLGLVGGVMSLIQSQTMLEMPGIGRMLEPPPIFVTGGDAELFHQRYPRDTMFAPNLTLEGVRLAADAVGLKSP